MEVQAELSPCARYLARLLHYPENIGVEMRGLSLGSQTPTPALLVWMDGLTDPFSAQTGVVKALGRIKGPPVPASLPLEILALRHEWTPDLDAVAEGIFAGRVALLVQGWQGALILECGEPVTHPVNKPSTNPNRDIFGRDLTLNVALLRKRLATSRLLALRLPMADSPEGAALLHVEGKAHPPLVRAVTRWLRGRLHEGQVLRGELSGKAAIYGLLPRFLPLTWPDDVAVLLDRGYLVLLCDRFHVAYIAPVTYAAILSLNENLPLSYPLRPHLTRLRIPTMLLVLLMPASVVALLNYHQEMLPTGLLLTLASTRENAPFGVFFEVLLMETLSEIGREIAFRLPKAVPVTAVLIVQALTTLLAVQVGLLGPMPGLAALLGSLFALAAPSYTVAYVVRMWRLYLLLAATLLGFFGIATVLGMLLTYLCQAKSWGVPVVGPSGWALTADGGHSAWPSFTGRGKRRARPQGQSR